MHEPTSDTIPIFPLGNVVLFPGTHVPLHIFEPRYREMTQAAIQSNRRIGMVAVQLNSDLRCPKTRISL